MAALKLWLAVGASQDGIQWTGEALHTSEAAAMAEASAECDARPGSGVADTLELELPPRVIFAGSAGTLDALAEQLEKSAARVAPGADELRAAFWAGVAAAVDVARTLAKRLGNQAEAEEAAAHRAREALQ